MLEEILLWLIKLFVLVGINGVCSQQCPRLFAPVNGSIIVTGYTPGGFAGYDCNDGLRLNGTTNLRTCLSNFTWSHADPGCIDIDECARKTDNCLSSAVCTNVFGSFTCACSAGYTGDGVTSCSDIDECSTGTSNCGANAQCTNTVGSFRCSCSTGFTGDGVTCTDIDECATGGDNCHPDAGCINNAGSFTCTCNVGFTGDGVTSCSDVNECTAETDNCHTNAQCVNNVGSFSCICNAGYTGSGVTCTDLDECSLGTDSCHQNAACSNTAGSYFCSCNQGYQGDGLTCTDVNECTTGTDNCDVNAQCVNSVGSFSCICNAGFTGNGVTCTDLDECSLGTDSCHQNAACSNNAGSYSCSCNTGYQGDGLTCTDVNECALGTHTCPVNAVCSNSVGSYMCICQSGYFVNGSSCTDIDECTEGSDNCSSNAVCTNNPGSFSCACRTGYTGNGVTCTDIDECQAAPCDVNAACSNSVGSFMCTCNFGYSGSGFSCTIADCGAITNTSTRLVVYSSSTFQATARFSCVTGYTLNGSATVMCLGNGSWQTFPKCDIQDCGFLTDPENGSVTYTNNVTTYGSMATFTCNTGFTLNGTNTSTCQANGEWSSQPPVCDIVVCPSLTALQDGHININFGTAFEGTAVYLCKTGYELVGDLFRICQANGSWTGMKPSCRIYDCGNLTDPVNGRVTAPVTTYGAEARYSCNTGYIISSNDTRTCEEAGVWNGTAPNCTIVNCGALSPTANGTLTQSGVNYNDVATYTCVTGYELIGSANLTCTANGNWSDNTPTCRLYDCGTLADPANGIVVFNGTVYNSLADYSCIFGYNLVGQSTRTCGLGVWSGADPLCNIADCRNLTDPAGATATFSNTTYLSMATYSCNPGHYQTGGDTSRTCQANSTWNGTEIACTIYSCPPLSNITDGTFVASGSNYGDTAKYTCKTGYELNGNSVLTCGTGSWDYPLPNCTIKNCGQLATSIPNGNVTQTGTFYGDTFSFVCDFGHVITSGVTNLIVNCTANGTWDSTAPSCVPADCGNVTAPANGQQNTQPGTTFLHVASFTCNLGYDLIGNNTRTCMADGLWNGSTPTCRIVDCGNLTDPANGTVNTTSGTTYGFTAVYVCDTGHEIGSGSVTRTCTLSSSWNGTQPTCVRKNCGSLTRVITNGSGVQSGTRYLDTTVYTCQTGYYFGPRNTSVTVMCTAAGAWSSLAPACQPVDCGNLTAPSGGQVHMHFTNYSSVAAFTCNKGHDLLGTNVRKCGADGAWDMVSPVCRIRDCGLLSNITNGFVSAPVTSYSAAATYSCDLGYRIISGSSVRYCQEDRQWSGSQPVCQIYNCGTATVPQTASVVSSTGTTYGSTVQLQCNVGYYLTAGNLTRTCGNGSWDGSAPICQLIDCGVPRNPSNMTTTMSYNGTVFGSTVTYSCITGHYAVSGLAQRVCNDSGGWPGAPLHCSIYDCGTLTNPMFGMVNLTGNTYNERALYSCFTGHNLVGDAVRICGAGSWNGSAPRCVIKDCGNLTTVIVGGSVNISGTTFGETAYYTCDVGFLTAETRTRTHLVTCTANGNWDSRISACNPINCGSVGNLTHGRIVTATGTGYLDVAIYQCDLGYQLIGNGTRTCRGNGFWEGVAPNCVIYDCGNLPHPSHGTVFYTRTEFSAEARYVCDIGFYISGGSVSRTCLNGGVWNGTMPTCTAFNCGPLSNPQNGRVTTTGQMYGDTAIYLCDTGFYRTSGNITRVCGNGTWSGVAPVCTIRNCGPLGNPVNGYVNLTGTNYGNTALYGCETGYFISRGDSVRNCRATGLWDGMEPICTPMVVTTQPTTRGIDPNERDMSCGFRHEDLVLGLAVSSMTSRSDFTIMKTVVKEAVKRSDLESGDVRIGIFVFDNAGVRQDTVVNLDAYRSRLSLQIVIDNITYSAATGPSRMLIGLNQVLRMFSLQNGDRPGVPNYVFIITDDNIALTNSLATASQIKNTGIHLDIIAVGFPSTSGLASLTFEPTGHIVEAETFTALDLLQRYILWKEEGCDCPIISAPANGRMTSSGNYYLDTATFLCFQGYTLVGTGDLVCQYGGVWSASPPRCVPEGLTEIPLPVLNTTCGFQNIDVIVGLAISSSTTAPQFEQIKNLLKTIIDHSDVQSGSTHLGYFIYGPGFAWQFVDLIAMQTRSRLLSSIDSFQYASTNGSSNLSYGLLQGYNMFMTAGNRVRQPDILYMVMDNDVEITGSSAIVNQIKDAGIHLDLITIGVRGVRVDILRALSHVIEYSSYLDFAAGTTSLYRSPQCNCQGLQSPANGVVFVEGTYFLDTAMFYCNQGYELIGSQKLICLDRGVWSNRPPTCSQQAPLRVVEMVVALNVTAEDDMDLIDDTKLAQYKPEFQAAFQCYYSDKISDDVQVVGLSLSNGSLIVNHSIAINNTEQASQKFVQSVLGLAEGAIVKVLNRTLAVTSLSLKDNPVDLVTASVETLTCVTFIQANGACDLGYVCQQVNGLPACVPDPNTDCGYPGNLKDGTVLTAFGTLYGSNATYICHPGFRLTGTDTRTCEPTGLWIHVAPTCVIKDNFCPENLTLQNGNVTKSDQSRVGSIATYNCNTGYYIIGQMQKLCSSSGVWMPRAATSCEIQDCGPLLPPNHGVITQTSGTKFGHYITFSCNPGYQLFGSATVTCKADGDWSSARPICQISVCEGLANPANGVVTAADNTIGQVANYSCNHGYSLQGTSTRTCQLNGTWTGTPPTCIIIDCGTLPHPAFGQVEYLNTQFGSIAVYTCLTGYRLVGQSERSCGADGQWTRTSPVCQVIDCGAPLPIQYGTFTSPATSLYNSTVTYTCNTGHQLIGHATSTCLESGIWSSAPLCSIVDCGLLSNPENGEVDLSGGTTYGQSAVFSCRTGYLLSGQGQLVCEATGNWTTSPPTCRLADCGMLADPANGQVNVSGTSYGDYATYVCDAGHHVAGTSSRMCQEDGIWSGSKPTCVAIDCGPLLPLDYGQLNMSSGTTYGSVAQFSCHSQFNLIGLASIVCRADGSWSGPPPTCHLKEGYLSENMTLQLNFTAPSGFDLSDTVKYDDYIAEVRRVLLFHYANVMTDNLKDVIIHSVRLGSLIVSYETVIRDTVDSSAQFVQASHSLAQGSTVNMFGQTLTASSVTVGTNLVNLVTLPDNSSECTIYLELKGPCQAGYICSVVGGTPACWPDPSIDCGVPAAPANGNVDYSRGTTMGVTIIYTCQVGYTLVGDNTRTCQADENYAPGMPSCVVTDCGPLGDPTNGFVTVAGTVYGSTASFGCNPGYSLIGSALITCQANGNWSSSPPTCRMSSCGALSSPTHGSVTLSANGQSAFYTCQIGYTLQGSAVRTCLTSDTWSGVDPTCQLTDCGAPTHPQNGRVEYNSTTYGSTAKYFCTQVGYEMIGMDTRMCAANGSWTGSPPTCRLIDCGMPGSVTNGVATLSGTTYGHTATYTCNPGHILQGSQTLTCGAVGWSSGPPTCVSAGQCVPLLEIQLGYIVLSSGNNYFSTATYSCSTGYTLVGNAVRTCLTNSLWSGVSPVCVLIDCGPLIGPPGGMVNFTSGSTYGMVAYYQCNPGYDLIGPAAVTCQDDGTWSHSPMCRIKDCGSLQNPDYGLVDTLAGTLFGAAAVYSCNPGYRLQGTVYRRCLATGLWNATEPLCIIKDCGLLNNTNHGSVSFPAGTSYGQTAMYTCDVGYKLTGSAARQCSENGIWTGDVPECIPIVCSSLSQPVNGKVTLSSGLAIGSVATYSCNQGYKLSSLDLVTRECLVNGTFTRSAPTCIFVDCGYLTSPMFGHMNMSGTAYQHVAVFSCNQGYMIAGSQERTCSEDGTWTGTQTECVVTNCGPLKSPDGGKVTLSEGSGYGNTATYECNSDHLLKGYYKRTCWSNGTWSGMAPTCDFSREFALAVGLGVGLTGFLVLVLTIVLIVAILYRRERSKRRIRKTYLVPHSIQSSLPLKMNTSSALYVPYYSRPMTYDNMSDGISEYDSTWKMDYGDQRNPQYYNKVPLDEYYPR